MMPGTADLPSDTDTIAKRSAIMGALAAYGPRAVWSPHDDDGFAADMTHGRDIGFEFLEEESLRREVRSGDLDLACH
jgi:hypothetical protein